MAEVGTETDGGVILECECKVNRKNYTINLTNSYLKWYISGSSELKDLHGVRVVDILSVKLLSSSKQNKDNDSVHVSYVKQENKLQLKLSSVEFKFTELQKVTSLHQQIKGLVGNIEQRPKKLLVIINPMSGRKKGEIVYTQTIEPIFQKVEIETEVIVTERAHHTEEILSIYDLKSIDGLIVVGGDGSYHEAVNGIMKWLTKEQGLNADNPDVELPGIPFRIGLIPCGTANGIAYGCYGNYDVTTAALSIALGYHLECKAISVHSGGKLVAYSILIVGYGKWGDLSFASESSRHQGVLRYTVAIVQEFFIKQLRTMNLTIKVKGCKGKESTKGSGQVCTNEQSTALEDIGKASSKDDVNTADMEGTNITTIKEHAVAAIISMFGQKTEDFTNRPDISRADMFLNKSSQRLKFVTFVMNLIMHRFDMVMSREDIIYLQGTEWSVSLDDPSDPDTENGQLEHCLNIDGEYYKLPRPEFQAKFLPQMIRLFSNMPYVTNREKT